MVIREWLIKCPLIAILRGVQPHEVEDVFGGLLEAGVAIAEIPLNSPEPAKSIRRANELLRKQDADWSGHRDACR